MNGVAVIDQFLNVFTTYIDSGFGLLRPEVAFLSGVLIAIDVTLAGLFWALGGEDILGRLVRKTLYVGLFAFFIGNWTTLTRIVFDSLAGLGLLGSGTGLSVQDFLQPGRLAHVGVQAGWPILQAIGGLMGFTSFFANFVQIFILLLAWLVVIATFFLLAVQLFITLIEFKLTSLAGFVLVPFGLWGRSAFLAERVLGFVITCGVKVLVLAVIIGIGSTLFDQFIAALPGNGQQPTINDALAIMLAAVAMLGLGIFGPTVASGLVSGAPQLGAGAVLGTAGAVVAGGMLATATAGAAVGLGRFGVAGGLTALRAGTSLASGAGTAYRLAAVTSGETGLAGAAAGIGGIGRAAAGAASDAVGVRQSAAAGRGAAWRATGGEPFSTETTPPSAPTGPADSAPAWAQRLRTEQARRAHLQTAAHAVREGDHAGGGAHPDLEQRDH